MPRVAVRKTYKLFIGGQFPRSESGRHLPVSDTQGGFVANVSRASRKDLRDAVRAARSAQPGWAARSAFNRGQIVYRAAEMLESRRASFETLLRDIAGYRPAAARKEVSCAIDRLVWYAGWSDKLAQVFGAVNPVAAPFLNFTAPEPVGVVAILAPRNAPLLGLVSSVVPALVAGNAVVAVADTAAPPVAIELAEAFATSDLPAGVVNILTGRIGELHGPASTHRDVDAIALFGGDAALRTAVERGAAESVMRVQVADDPTAAGWLEPSRQSPYRILPFLEFKTTWHPIGR